MLAEERGSQNIARDCRRLLVLLFQAGHLNLFFARHRLFRHGRVQQYVRKQINAQFQIGLRDMDRKAATVIARVTANRTPDSFDLIRDLLRCPRFRSFEQRFGHQSRDAVGLRRFSEQSASEHGAYRDQRQARVFAHENSQAVGKFELLDLAGIDGPAGLPFREQ